MDVGGTVSPVGQFDPHAVLSPHELMWIMDEMAARELAWLRGSTMAQTIFTSLHYHNALELRPGMTAQDPRFEAAEAACVALRAFVLAFAKSVDLVYAAFLDTNGPARDGEDVWLDPYGIPLETTETPDEVVAYLDQITLWLEDRMEMEAENGWEQVVMRLRFRKVSGVQDGSDASRRGSTLSSFGRRVHRRARRSSRPRRQYPGHSTT